MNKRFNRWSLMNILFAILVSIPMWSIIVRTAYVIFNKNAYESYSGTEEVYYKKPIENVQRLIFWDSGDNVFDDYEPNYDLGKVKLVGYKIPYHTNLFIDDANLGDFNINDFNEVAFLSYDSNMFYIYFEFRFDSELGYFDMEYDFNYYQTDRTNYIDFIVTDDTDIENEMWNNFISDSPDTYYDFEMNTITTLDNVFDYSIDKFNDENDAHFDFVNNVASLFLTEDSYGWRYVEFINWYFNYFIVVTGAYIIFLVIVWFLQFARKILERSHNLW